MSNKELVIEAVRGLPEEATFDEIAEPVAILAAIRKGLEAGAAGRVTPHDEVRGQVATWITK